MSRLIEEATDKLNSVDWKSFLLYDESVETCLKYKSEFRKGRNNSKVRRVTIVAGSLTSEGRYSLGYDKSLFSIQKIIWVMHYGNIPKGYTIWFKDNNCLNVKISNLELREITFKPPEKYSKLLHDYFEYDENSPSCLIWKKLSSKSSTVKIGDSVGSFDYSDGYYKLHGLSFHYRVHRVIWFLHYGKIPTGWHVDHIDRNRSNNKISNLRIVPQSINGKNRTKNSNNKTGVNGISYSESFNIRGTLIQKYIVCLTCNGIKYNKSFSIIKYGKEKAWQLALNYKQELVLKFKEECAGFTEDHGT